MGNYLDILEILENRYEEIDADRHSGGLFYQYSN